MIARDFIEEVRVQLQEKSTFWKPRELFLKLVRAYNLLQFDMPFFTCKENLEAKRNDDYVYLTHEALENVSLHVNGILYRYAHYNHLYHKQKNRYTFENDKVIFACCFDEDVSVEVHYKYAKRLENENCALELPAHYLEALRVLFLSFIHEKPRLNSKERNLSAYYKKEYALVLNNISRSVNLAPKNIKSIYQRI